MSRLREPDPEALSSDVHSFTSDHGPTEFVGVGGTYKDNIRDLEGDGSPIEDPATEPPTEATEHLNDFTSLAVKCGGKIVRVSPSTLQDARIEASPLLPLLRKGVLDLPGDQLRDAEDLELLLRILESTASDRNLSDFDRIPGVPSNPLEYLPLIDVAQTYERILSLAILWKLPRNLIRLPLWLWTSTRWTDLNAFYSIPIQDIPHTRFKPSSLQLSLSEFPMAVQHSVEIPVESINVVLESGPTSVKMQTVHLPIDLKDPLIAWSIGPFTVIVAREAVELRHSSANAVSPIVTQLQSGVIQSQCQPGLVTTSRHALFIRPSQNVGGWATHTIPSDINFVQASPPCEEPAGFPVCAMSHSSKCSHPFLPRQWSELSVWSLWFSPDFGLDITLSELRSDNPSDHLPLPTIASVRLSNQIPLDSGAGGSSQSTNIDTRVSKDLNSSSHWSRPLLPFSRSPSERKWVCFHPELPHCYMSSSVSISGNSGEKTAKGSSSPSVPSALLATGSSVAFAPRTIRFYHWGALFVMNSPTSGSQPLAIISVDDPDMQKLYGERTLILLKGGGDLRPLWDVAVAPDLSRVFLLANGLLLSQPLSPSQAAKVTFSLSSASSGVSVLTGAPASFGELHCLGVLGRFDPSTGLYYRANISAPLCGR